MSDGKHDRNYIPQNTLEYFLQSDTVFTVFFIIESFISILADGMKRSVRTFWGMFNIFIFFSSIATLCGLMNFSPLRLWIILKYLSRIPILSDIEMILKAIKKSFDVLRDIAVFAIFLFICAGIVGVSLWGGKFKYRCVNSENEFFDENLVCSINPDSGYQCPQGFNCTNVNVNPASDTMGFDNILQAWLTIFQILTTEGWSNIMINGINSTNSLAVFYFLVIIMFGNWLLLQLIVATVTTNLESSIENEQNENKKDDSNTSNTITDSSYNTTTTIAENQTITEKENSNSQDIASEKSVVLYNSETNNPTADTIIETDVSDEQSVKTVSIQNLNTSTMDNFYSLSNKANGNTEIQSVYSKSEESKKSVSGLRRKLIEMFSDLRFDYFVLIITTIDVVALCSNHKDTSQEFIRITSIISFCCTIIFGIEMLFKLYAFGFKRYVSSYFNIFDGLITIASFVELFLPNNQGMLALRVIRAMRILRISKFSKSLIDLAVIIRDSSKQLLSLGVIWIVSVVIFSALCIQIFSGEMNSDEGVPRANFDTMTNAILTVIQLYTVENWNDIEESVARHKSKIYILILIVIIIIGAYILSQILVAILLSAFTEKIKQDMEDMKKQYVGKQAKFTIKRAFNDLFENVKEKNSNYSDSVDGDDKSYKSSKAASINSKSKHNKKSSNGMDDDKKSTITTTTIGNSATNITTITNVNSSVNGNGNGNARANANVNKRNNSEPYLCKEDKHISGNHHVRALSNQKRFSHVDLKDKNLAHLRMTPYHEHDSDLMYNSSVNGGEGRNKHDSMISVNTKYAQSQNDTESMESNRIHKRNVTRFFDDDSSINSLENSPSTPYDSSIPNTPVTPTIKQAKESKFMHHYHLYRESSFVKGFQVLSENKYYLFVVYALIISSCVSLIYDSPNQKNQKLLNTLRYFDIFFSIIFCIELFINLIAKGAFIEKKAYLRSFVNWIDVVVIIISIMSAFKIAESVHAFRVLRVLRVFRLVKLHEGMRIVFVAIWKTIPSLATALIPYLFFLIITSAMGLSMFVGEGWQCNDDSVRNKAECIGAYYYDNGTSMVREEKIWERYELGYDNILDSLQTSLVITNQEGWPDIMYRYIDSAGIDQQPIRDNRQGASIFYILSVLIGNWIFLAVVTGITFDSMKRNQDILKGLHHLTYGQRKLLDYISIIISNKPKPPPGKKKRSKIQQKLYDFFKSNTYEYIVFFVVLINIIIMVFARANSTTFESNLQIISEYVFTSIYIIEVILLFYAYKPRYFFSSSWNVLNLIITIFAVTSIIFEYFSQPNYLSVFRLLRIIRLVKFAKGLKALASPLFSILLN